MNILKGRIFSFLKRPEDISDIQSFLYIEDGGIVFDEIGIIEEVDEFSAIRRRHPNSPITDFGSNLICPGFIDVHNHFPQTQVIASYGSQLLEWLSKYTFPNETWNMIVVGDSTMRFQSLFHVFQDVIKQQW